MLKNKLEITPDNSKVFIEEKFLVDLILIDEEDKNKLEELGIECVPYGQSEEQYMLSMKGLKQVAEYFIKKGLK